MCDPKTIEDAWKCVQSMLVWSANRIGALFTYSTYPPLYSQRFIFSSEHFSVKQSSSVLSFLPATFPLKTTYFSLDSSNLGFEITWLIFFNQCYKLKCAMWPKCLFFYLHIEAQTQTDLKTRSGYGNKIPIHFSHRLKKKV